MTHRKKITSQSGFMSVEAVATALFYLIMVAIITLIASTIMNTGRMANTVSTLSLLRVNVQYVGTSVGDYSQVKTLSLPTLVTGMLHDLSTPVAGKATLPTKHVVSLDKAAATDVDETGATVTSENAFFHMDIDGLSFEECRRVAYYGLGAGYGVMVADTGATVAAADKVSGVTTVLQTVETKCNDTTKKRLVRLISR